MSRAAGLGRRLPRSFFARPSTVVAPELLGRVLVRVLPDGTRLAARLVEVEAYEQGIRRAIRTPVGPRGGPR